MSSNRRDPQGQFSANILTEAIKAFGDVPAAYDTLIDLGDNYIYTHFLVVNSLNENIVIKFGNSEITFQANKDIWMDGIKLDGIIQYKYKVGAPTSGSIQVICY